MYGHMSGLHINSMWNPRAVDHRKGGWINIEPNPMIHRIGDSLKISYRHKANDQLRIVWYPMLINKKIILTSCPLLCELSG